MDVEDLAAVRATATASQPAHQLVTLDSDVNRQNLSILFPRQYFERLRLRKGPGKSVENVSVLAVGEDRPLANDICEYSVAHETARFLDTSNLATKFRVLFGNRTQDVARRDLRDSAALLEHLCLRALAGAGGAKQDQDLSSF